MVQHARDALHGGGNAEDIARAHGAVRIAIALEGKTSRGAWVSGTSVDSGKLSSGGAVGMRNWSSCTQLPRGIGARA